MAKELTVLMETTDQKPHVNPKSRVLLCGQNPPAWFARTGRIIEQLPFGIRPDMDLKENLDESLAQPWAAQVAFYIDLHTRQFPSLVNLVGAVTKENEINDDLVAKYGQLYPMINDLPNLGIIFAFGNVTYSYVQKILSGLSDAPCCIKLRHPSYIIRFHRDNCQMQREEFEIIHEALTELGEIK